MKYIEGHGKETGCIFCDALKQNDEQALIVAQMTRAYVILNRYP
jgi:diadenosine tetraphosphate (Ap4A) HIT family hydrolase